MAYIDREKAVQICQSYYEYFLKCGDGDAYDIRANIQGLPTADVVEVKHGEWESKGTHGDFEEKRCSICNGLLLVKWYDRTMNYNYCPNCGAKMDLKEGAEE